MQNLDFITFTLQACYCSSVSAETPSCLFSLQKQQRVHLGFFTFGSTEDFFVVVYLLQSNRIEFGGGDVSRGEGGGGGTGAIGRTVHINKVRFADVKRLLFKKLI